MSDTCGQKLLSSGGIKMSICKRRDQNSKVVRMVNYNLPLSMKTAILFDINEEWTIAREYISMDGD